MAYDLQKYRRDYYRSHKSEFAARDKAYRESNRRKCVQNTLRCRSKNPDRFKDYQRIWREKNRDRIAQQRDKDRDRARAYHREYYKRRKHDILIKTEKRRALKMAVAVNIRAVKGFQERVRGSEFVFCYYCERGIAGSEAHFDHIVPLVKGGPHSVENLCVSCPKCNWSKGQKLLSEWRKPGQQVFSM